MVAPDASSPSPAQILNLERATKYLHIIPALLESSDGRCSWQEVQRIYQRRTEELDPVDSDLRWPTSAPVG